MDIAPFVSKWEIVMYGHNMVVGCHVKHGCMVKVKSGCRNIENGDCYNWLNGEDCLPYQLYIEDAIESW
jgi:hypothetical protein